MTDETSEILEAGFWCHYEGMYFGDEVEVERGHFGYPCGEDDANGQFIPHVVSAVAIVVLEAEVV